jgi:hypothetical protein
MNNYSSGAWTTQEDQLGASFQQVSTTTAQDIISLPGMSTILETRDVQSLFDNG